MSLERDVWVNLAMTLSEKTTSNTYNYANILNFQWDPHNASTHCFLDQRKVCIHESIRETAMKSVSREFRRTSAGLRIAAAIL